ncbi:MAG: molybdopterin-dependent oxidoreductase, partial [Paracoccaceae bacterium]|nr:molybdopterin-dependent oxidoreductase [Paracoccaceae bacterium]
TGRGEDAEITSYLNETLDTNLQGNIIDLCPVGALTSKPYAFTARPWELTKTESIDVMDALGSNIRVDTKGREVKRFVPLNHDGVNEEWISDKTRFVWDGLRRQRLDTPYIRENGKLRKASWGEALAASAAAMSGKKVAGLVGDLAPTEAAFALKQLIEIQGGNVECRVDGSKLPAGNRSGYVGTASIEDIDSAKTIYLIATNPRDEAPVLNARLRRAWINGADIKVIGQAVDLTYDYEWVGPGRASLEKAVKSASATDGALVIVGQGGLTESDGEAVLAQSMALTSALGGSMLVLHTAAGRVGAMDVNATTDGGIDAALDGAEVIYNLGVDEIAMPDGAFVIYQGSHGDNGAHRADIILPGAAYTEENGLFVNTEGRPQLALRAAFPPGEAKENWAILRALSSNLGSPLAYDSLAQLRQALVAEVPHLVQVDQVVANEWQPLAAATLEKGKFQNAIADFYLTNPITRASALMGELSANAKARNATKVAAE